MKVAYLDTSASFAVAASEPGAQEVTRQLDSCGRWHSSNLLEAELRSAFAREGHSFEDAVVAEVRWVLPDRSLAPEFARVLAAGYLTGADLMHVACALYLEVPPQDVLFATLDRKQGEVAAALGFQTLEPVSTDRVH